MSMFVMMMILIVSIRMRRRKAYTFSFSARSLFLSFWKEVSIRFFSEETVLRAEVKAAILLFRSSASPNVLFISELSWSTRGIRVSVVNSCVLNSGHATLDSPCLSNTFHILMSSLIQSYTVLDIFYFRRTHIFF